VANSNTVFIVSKARQFIERKKLHLKSRKNHNNLRQSASKNKKKK